MTKSRTYAQRAEHCVNPTAKKLLLLMESKCTNLAVAADVTKKKELLSLAESLGPHICVFKTHIDIVEDFDESLIFNLQEVAKRHQFLIFEDRKFADIGNTVQQQYGKGIYKISHWAHITNAHPLPGPGIIQGLKNEGISKGRGLLLLAEMSTSGSLITQSYTKAALDMAIEHRDFVIGFIVQRKISEDPAFIHFTPGVHLSQEGDPLGQQYNSPEEVIVNKGCDVIIVGRGILQDADPIAATNRYREASWKAYQIRSQNEVITSI